VRDLIGDALEMLDVDGSDDADARAENLQDILPAFFVPPGARHVGVGQLVDQGDLGPSAQDRVEVHLLQAAPPVFDHLAGTTSRPLISSSVSGRP
jgi:hypothetical protein